MPSKEMVHLPRLKIRNDNLSMSFRMFHYLDEAKGL
jgi:hypothetical protein